jgi:predicted glycogen debranching enzyme
VPSSITPLVVAFGRETCGVLEAGLRREWLVTNGLGGYASGTLEGVLTRRYHGLLVAALSPPVARTVLVAGAVERAVYDGHDYPLSAHEFGGGVIEPRGFAHMQAFELDGQLPVWTFALGDALLERRVWMQHGANTTWLTWRLLRGALPVELSVTPLLTYRDFHTLTRASAPPRIAAGVRDITVHAFDGATPYRLLADSGAFQAHGDWWWNFHHRDEAARGLDDASDLYAPGMFTVTLRASEQFALALTAQQDVRLDAAAALASERERQGSLLRAAGVTDALPALRQLTLAADQFIVERRAIDAASPTIIAGYHWFNDWGRDTLIALPGLTLATGRAAEGAAILRAFARYVSDGLLPNNFPDQAGQPPGYNSADAALWFAVALQRHYAATGDEQLVDELLPTLREIVDAHMRGTRYGIGVDPADGLLRAGEPGLQLTWMDAKVGKWVVTPRVGKPVELNALWHGTLRIVAEFLTRRGDPTAAARHNALANRTQASFRERFVRPDLPQLADVVDGPDGDDWSVRPSQLLALSLPWPLLDGDAAARVLECVGRALLTTYGLRSLAPDNPAYQGGYGGAPLARDGAYHQGPAWTWLAGPYAEAHYRVHGDRAAALALLTPFAQHLRDAGLGSISEILDGDPPHNPRGAIAQAWGVAEVLRVWRLLLDAL